MNNNGLEKWRNDEKALDVERRLMNEALARLGQADRKHGMGRSAGRLIFALDLTGSREASLRQARIATSAMFDTIRAIGAVAVKLVYYRGSRECRASEWQDDPAVLSESMRRLSCEAGYTQIARVLRLTLAEEEKVSGVVFVGDHFEDAESAVLPLAETLGQRSIPIFVFHEIADHDERSLEARPIFERIAELSGGVYCEFKSDSGAVLRELLSSVAAFSAAGIEGVKQVAMPETPEGQQLQERLLLFGPAGTEKRR